MKSGKVYTDLAISTPTRHGYFDFSVSHSQVQIKSRTMALPPKLYHFLVGLFALLGSMVFGYDMVRPCMYGYHNLQLG